MTKKDYQLLVAAQVSAALTLRRTGTLDVPTFTTMVRSMATALATENPRFNTEKFYSAIISGVL